MKKIKLNNSLIHIVFLVTFFSLILGFMSLDSKTTKSKKEGLYQARINAISHYVKNYNYTEEMYQEDLKSWKNYDLKIINDYREFLKNNKLEDRRNDVEIINDINNSRDLFEYKISKFEQDGIFKNSKNRLNHKAKSSTSLNYNEFNENEMFKLMQYRFKFNTKKENEVNFYQFEKLGSNKVYSLNEEEYFNQYYLKDPIYHKIGNMYNEKRNHFVISINTQNYLEAKEIVNKNINIASYQNAKNKEYKIFKYINRESSFIQKESSSEHYIHKMNNIIYLRWLEKENRLNNAFNEVKKENFMLRNTLKEIRLNKIAFNKLTYEFFD